MSRHARSLVAVLLLLAAASAASAQEVQTTEGAIPGRYIVVLDDQQVARAAVSRWRTRWPASMVGVSRTWTKTRSAVLQ